jgi:hypothetical protein
MEERHLAKVEVAGSKPVSRSNPLSGLVSSSKSFLLTSKVKAGMGSSGRRGHRDS